METTEFKASNGYTLQGKGRLLRIHDDLGVNTLTEDDFINEEDKLALRELFQHQRDEELGRWRWPERPDYLVYPVGEGVVDVIRERSISDVTPGPGRQQGVTRDSAYNWDKAYSKTFYNAARAYFDAHPISKPWHDAKPGEVWVFDWACDQDVAKLEPSGQWRKFDGEAITTGDMSYVTAARRIYPEA